MQVVESLHQCLDAYTVPDYLREMDIAIEVSKVVPGWFFGIHPLRQDGQLIDLFVYHIHADLAFDKGDDHQGHKIEEQHGFNAVFLFQENRSYLQNSFLSIHAFLKKRLTLIFLQHLTGFQRRIGDQGENPIGL